MPELPGERRPVPPPDSWMRYAEDCCKDISQNVPAGGKKGQDHPCHPLMTLEEFETWVSAPLPRRTLVVGVLNVTPDSFSDGGQFLSADAALRHARQMLADGADILDIGGESTRPGSLPVDSAEQMRRVLPVLRSIRSVGSVLSIDTTRAEVAEAALEAGATMINDVSAAADDPGMPRVMASARATVLMHRPGPAKTMQQQAVYEDVVEDVAVFLERQAMLVETFGLASDRIFLDPGIGFGKTLEQNLRLLRELQRLTRGPRPVYVGTSRKRFIGAITGEPEAAKRVMGTAATVAWSVFQGVAAVRVHDVRAMRQTVDMCRAILEPGGLVDDSPQ